MSRPYACISPLYNSMRHDSYGGTYERRWLGGSTGEDETIFATLALLSGGSSDNSSCQSSSDGGLHLVVLVVT